MTAAEFLHETSRAMGERYAGDCLVHARRIAELLETEGKSPWIARIHEQFETDKGVFHAPLIPKRFPDVTWNTHYVAGAGNEAYDPLVGEPIDVAEYAVTVFGCELTIDCVPWSSFRLASPSSSSSASR
jgi:hypothetical protein